MALYISFVAVLIIGIIVLYYRRVRQHYIMEAVYEFHAAKHDVLMFLADHNEDISDKDLTDLRGFLNFLNETINSFYSMGGIKFATVKTIINNILWSNNKISDPHPDILKNNEYLTMHLQEGMKNSIKAIPLFKLRLVTHLIQLILKVLILLGIKKAHNYLMKLNRFIILEDNNEDNHIGQHCT